MQTPTSVKVNELPKKLVSVNSILGRFEHGPFSSEYLRDVNLAQQAEESQARQGINFSVFPVKEIFRLIQRNFKFEQCFQCISIICAEAQ